MTYNASIPIQTNSPSVFPAQCQVNWVRLQTLLGADHQFNLTEPAPPSNDGYHNLIHMTQQAPSGALASTGRLYVKTQGSLIQLFYMDDAGTEYQITPSYDTVPMKVAGSDTIAGNGDLTIFNEAYDFTGFGFVFISGTNNQKTYSFMRSGSETDQKSLDENDDGIAPPSLFFDGTILKVLNNSSQPRLIVWSLMINRL